MFGSQKGNDLDGHLFHIDNPTHQKDWFLHYECAAIDRQLRLSSHDRLDSHI